MARTSTIPCTFWTDSFITTFVGLIIAVWHLVLFWLFQRVRGLYSLIFLTLMHISTADGEHHDSEEFRHFWWALFHGSLKEILKSLQPGMENYSVVHFGDGHYHCTVLGLSPYIADYPEQALLACIVQGWCTKYTVYCCWDGKQMLTASFRCVARSKKLDGPCGWWMHELTAHLQQITSMMQLWDHYGIIDGIMVGLVSLALCHWGWLIVTDSHSPIVLTYTSCFLQISSIN